MERSRQASHLASRSYRGGIPDLVGGDGLVAGAGAGAGAAGGAGAAAAFSGDSAMGGGTREERMGRGFLATRGRWRRRGEAGWGGDATRMGERKAEEGRVVFALHTRRVERYEMV